MGESAQQSVRVEKPQPIAGCRICGSRDLVDVFSLGNIALSDFVQEGGEILVAPLDLVMCNPEAGCALVQLKHKAIDRELIYRQYWYKSGVNQTMRDALADITSKAEQLIALQPQDVVIDIGANDGTLLRSYRTQDIIKIGFEPAKNLVEEAKEGDNTIIPNFFNYAEFKKTGMPKAKIIMSIAMFYDLEDPNAFVADIKQCLAEDGIWIMQLAYQPVMLEQNGFDNIIHEHIEYYSLRPIEALLAKHNLELFDLEFNDVNGGSIRTYIRHQGAKTKTFAGAQERIKKTRQEEAATGVNTVAVYQAFSDRVEKIKQQTVDFIQQVVADGKKVHVYGASTKGNTILQYFGLDHALIEAAAERNPSKWGLKTVVTGIPIISEAESRAAKSDYYFVLPWHFLPEFLKREKAYLDAGGHFIVPLPEFKVI